MFKTGLLFLLSYPHVHVITHSGQILRPELYFPIFVYKPKCYTVFVSAVALCQAKAAAVMTEPTVS